MLKRVVMALPLAAGLASAAGAADFDPAAAHAGFMDAFNGRDWQAVKAKLAADAVFHRANAGEVQSGPDAIVAHFEQPIGGEWNVKFVRLDSKDQLVGNDGRVVERGDFAITAGADDGACYAGSYLATWAPDGDAWRLQVLTWQGPRDRPVELQIETGPPNALIRACSWRRGERAGAHARPGWRGTRLLRAGRLIVPPRPSVRGTGPARRPALRRGGDFGRPPPASRLSRLPPRAHLARHAR